jgi:hypothetical protein
MTTDVWEEIQETERRTCFGDVVRYVIYFLFAMEIFKIAEGPVASMAAG